ncbi:MAG TPA: alpha/beta hydrolase [Acidimicrobiia bacterium]|nr:alpha/beta hydrolase [Acidimicrobiia bacterium]
MGDYVDANGVHTYYEQHGSGDPLLLLHGGLAAAESFAQQTPVFAERYRVVIPERRGHGRTPDVEGPITYELMADDTIAFMDALGTGPTHLVGWSDGGNVGLIVAIKRPDLVRKLVTIGSNFSADGLTREARAAFTPGTPNSIVPGMRALWEVTAVDPGRFDVVLEKMQRCWFRLRDPEGRARARRCAHARDGRRRRRRDLRAHVGVVGRRPRRAARRDPRRVASRAGREGRDREPSRPRLPRRRRAGPDDDAAAARVSGLPAGSGTIEIWRNATSRG